ncbi:helix-turn-helix domain-containing protein [Mariniblastus fucicola]|nr:helix-turn-helix transcriptional regulator [Mariniblastus fucicola]
MLKFFRKRKGWSQQQLCEAADVSVRVVCKAETGAAISTTSIDKFSTALSMPEHEVYPEDLISDPRQLAERFVNALHVHRQNLLDSIGDMIDPGAEFRIVGNPRKIPFAGLHRGPRAYRRALKKFYQIFEIPNDFDHTTAYEYFPKGTEVVLWGATCLRLVGSKAPAEKVQYRKRFRFRRGILVSFEDHYDVEKGEQSVATAAEVQGKKVYDPLEDSTCGINL